MSAVTIESRHSHHLLDVQGDLHSGAQVVVQRASGRPSQVWIHTSEGYIQSASNPNLVLDVKHGKGKGSEVIVWEKKPLHDAQNQLWTFQNGVISNRGLALDINGGSRDSGAKIIVWSPNGQNNQSWTYNFVPDPVGPSGYSPSPSYDTEYFIVSKNSGLVLDVEGGGSDGARVISWHKKPVDNANQLWVLEQDGSIASAANRNWAIDIRNEGGKGSDLIVWPKHGHWNQKWVFDNGVIRNQRDRHLVFDVPGGNTNPGTHTVVWEAKHSDNLNQLWTLEPANAPSYSEPLPQVSLQKDVPPPSYQEPPPPSVSLYKPETPQPSVSLYKETHVDLTKTTTTTTTTTFDNRGVWSNVDSVLDQIIALASSLKEKGGEVRAKYDALFSQKDSELKRIDADREAAEAAIRNAANDEERTRLQQVLSEKEAQEKQKLAEYDVKIHNALLERERAEREAESLKSNSKEEKDKIVRLLGDLEEDAITYQRLRPSKPILDENDVNTIRALFLSSAVSGTGKLSFGDLRQVIAKYEVAQPEGNLKKLFKIVEEDSKGRMSYATMVAVANDMAALVGDFRKIDANGNGSLSRKELREHLGKLGFTHRSSVDAIFSFADEDESDEVTFQEFVHLSITLIVLRLIYTTADYDKNGQLNKTEILRILSEAAIPAPAISKFDHFYSVVDADDSGALSFNEFVLLVLNMFSDE